MQKKIIDYMADSVVEEISDDAIEKIMKDWESVYCPLSKKEKEKICFGDFKWHVFSNKSYKSIEGEKALKEYNNKVSRIFYVIPEIKIWPKEKAFMCKNLPPSELATKLKDFYVFPKNLAWSMAFTHEHRWLGPYFAKHKNFKILNMKNIQSVEAIDRGW
ncbi:hypothetical protein MNBD_UNCLBAC01-2041 [hydrothermal vent metagenome]|uniref:Uncharacterized protein n=1 Tax=hydrothermal vent metagenome TaxID=652676 RepID=A0A3B1E5S9_9ZZZZ